MDAKGHEFAGKACGAAPQAAREARALPHDGKPQQWPRSDESRLRTKGLIMEIPQEGRYNCKLNGQVVIYEAGTGSLCAALPCAMLHNGFTFKHTMTLVTRDGTVQTRTVDTFKQVFGWDGADPFWLMDASADGGPMRELEFEIVGGPETGDKGGLYFKSQWLNPVGGGKTPVAADRRSVLAKYGSKFAALAGAGQNAECGTRNAERGTGSRQTPPLVPKVAPLAPPPGAPTATMEEAWAALNEAQPGKPPEVLEKLWFDTIARLFPNKSNTDLKPHEWGKLKAEFADNVPM